MSDDPAYPKGFTSEALWHRAETMDSPQAIQELHARYNQQSLRIAELEKKLTISNAGWDTALDCVEKAEAERDELRETLKILGAQCDLDRKQRDEALEVCREVSGAIEDDGTFDPWMLQELAAKAALLAKPEKISREDFQKHLEENAKKVEAMPDWQRGVITGSGKPAADYEGCDHD